MIRLTLNLGLVALFALAAAAVGTRLAGFEMQTVLSGSMQPLILPGDIAITHPTPAADLDVGDVIAFYPPDETTPVLHRITSVASDADGIVVTTRGDANNIDDPWNARLGDATAYRLVAVVPKLGWLTVYRGPLFILAGLILAAVLANELRKEILARRPSPA